MVFYAKQIQAVHYATHCAHSVADQQTTSITWSAGDANAVANLKKIFDRMGLSTQQLVALCGAHYIARWGRESSTDPKIFDKHYRDLNKRFSNAYFRQVFTSVYFFNIFHLQPLHAYFNRCKLASRRIPSSSLHVADLARTWWHCLPCACHLQRLYTVGTVNSCDCIPGLHRGTEAPTVTSVGSHFPFLIWMCDDTSCQAAEELLCF